MPRGRYPRNPRFAAEVMSSDDIARMLVDVDERLAGLKHRISLATLAAMRGATDTPSLVRAALEEVDSARRLLAKASEA